MVTNPRQAAIELFLNWEKSIHTLDFCITQMQPRLEKLSPKDRKFFNAVVFGVLRHRNMLDWIISHYSHIPVQKIQQPALYLLRSAILQVHFMDKIPDFAAIDTSVTIAKKYGGKKTAGFVNAVLRKITQNKSDLAYPVKDRPKEKDIRITYSLPKWLTKKWIKRYGSKDTTNLARQINTIPDITLRCNTLKVDRDTLIKNLSPCCKAVKKSDFANLGIRLKGPSTPLHEMDDFKKGMFQVQDDAAQIVTQILSPEPDENILDACAGLGGKTCHIAQQMGNRGSVTAIDIEDSKLEALTGEAKRLGITIIKPKSMDLLTSTIKNFPGFFNRVLLDAPCSGLGVLRRNPDTKWRRTNRDIQRLAARQKKLLNAAANLVAPGGVLVFAVCSCEKEENEDVIFSFLKKRKDFSIDKDYRSDRFKSLVTPEGFFKTYPAINNMDGFFAARLKRK